jgi:hypothetical protein
MERDFIIGDTVEFYREPTPKEWKGVGEIPIVVPPNTPVYIREISQRTGSLKVAYAETDTITFGWYPKEAFRFADPDYIPFDLIY